MPIDNYFNRSDTNPYLDGTKNPLERKFTPDRDQLTTEWIKAHNSEVPYTFPNLIIELPGGVAVSAFMSLAILYWMAKNNLRAPLIVGRSAPAMPLALLQQGFSLRQIYELMTYFETDWIRTNRSDLIKNFPTSLNFIS